MSSSKNLEFEKTSFLSKSNSAFIERMYLKFVNKDADLPESWKDYTIERKFRANKYIINILNDGSKSRGVDFIEIDGKKISGNTIPFQEGEKTVKVKVYMRK